MDDCFDRDEVYSLAVDAAEEAALVSAPVEEVVARYRPRLTYGTAVAGEYTNFFWHLRREREFFRCAMNTILS